MLRITTSILLVILLGEAPVFAASSYAYVWDFEVCQNKEQGHDAQRLAERFTELFEEELLRARPRTPYRKLLVRRRYSRLFAHVENESGIRKMVDIPDKGREILRTVSADTVVFGEVCDDPQSGEYRVTVIFEHLSGTIAYKKQIEFGRARRDDARTRRQAMRALLMRLFPDRSHRATRLVILGSGIAVGLMGLYRWDRGWSIYNEPFDLGLCDRVSKECVDAEALQDTEIGRRQIDEGQYIAVAGLAVVAGSIAWHFWHKRRVSRAQHITITPFVAAESVGIAVIGDL